MEETCPVEENYDFRLGHITLIFSFVSNEISFTRKVVKAEI